MNGKKMKLDFPKRLEHLFSVISETHFLEMKGLGNEIPFFICPFDPPETDQMEKLRKTLVTRLLQSGVQVLEIDLYDLSIEILKGREIFDRILTEEPSFSKEQLKELLQGILDPELHLVPAIAAKIREKEIHGGFSLMFLSGVGEVFPYIRSHNVLNNLQKVAKEKPTVMFFPGAYTHSREFGTSLELFGRLRDDKYYRAFNIYHCEPYSRKTR